jgi:hypothetical protein
VARNLNFTNRSVTLPDGVDQGSSHAMLGQLQMDECPLRWITIDDFGASHPSKATPKGMDSNCPCHGQRDTECPGPIDQELWAT